MASISGTDHTHIRAQYWRGLIIIGTIEGGKFGNYSEFCDDGNFGGWCGCCWFILFVKQASHDATTEHDMKKKERKRSKHVVKQVELNE